MKCAESIGKLHVRAFETCMVIREFGIRSFYIDYARTQVKLGQSLRVCCVVSVED